MLNRRAVAFGNPLIRRVLRCREREFRSVIRFKDVDYDITGVDTFEGYKRI